MICIEDKAECVGCRACEQICPKQCIIMLRDDQGFIYPKVDLKRCIHCNLCEKVCLVLNQGEVKLPQKTYAARNKDEKIEEKSSSGGVFSALVEYVINDKGGVVFGARFDENWNVIHDYAETLDEAEAFRTSKYVQSDIKKNYVKAKEFLSEGRTVLFSGTPCQIAGLNLFLRKDYGERLITVDFVCHGVPSPAVWSDYLRSLEMQMHAGAGKNTDLQSGLEDSMPVITGISFRDKRLGWKKYGFAIRAVARKGDKNSDLQSVNACLGEQELLFEPHPNNLYMRGFLKDLYLRPSCYRCPAKSGKSQSDITIADFWGIDVTYPELYSKGFYSLVLVWNNTMRDIIESINTKKADTTYEKALAYNPAIELSARKPKQYEAFWSDYRREGLCAIGKTLDKMKPTVAQRCVRKLKKVIKHVFKVIAK